MLYFPYSVFFLCTVLIPVYAISDHMKLFMQDDIPNIKVLFSCVNITAMTLFDNGNRIGVICYKCGYLQNEIIKTFMQTQPIVVSSTPMYIKKRRNVSYVVFVSKFFAESRRELLKKDPNLHTLQYLFISKAREETVIAFATELWQAGFRDIAFLTRDNSGGATIQMPVMKETIILRSVGYCSTSGNNLDNVQPYSSDFYRFCAQIPCTLLYGTVVDGGISFWRQEDLLKSQEMQGLQTMGTTLIERFISLYNIEKYRMDIDRNWTEAAEKIINDELDIIMGLIPNNFDVMEDMKVICWFRDRKVVFAAKVRQRVFDYPVLKLLTPFHYSVWICVMVTLLLYILLLCALRKLAAMRLIKERLNFMQIYEIMLGQSITFPQKTSLRSILALWMIFSLNMSIIYDSTFTSSLADLDTEIILKNLKELQDSGLPIGGPAIIQDYLNGSDDPVIRNLRDRYIVMESAEQMLDAIMSNQTMAVIQRIVVNKINWVNRMNRSLRLYTLAEPKISFPVFFYTRRAHPYRAPLKRIVTEYRESGLLYKWIKYYVVDEDKQKIHNHENEDDDDGGILTMEHLGPVFQFFFMCQAISVLIFLLEVSKICVRKTR